MKKLLISLFILLLIPTVCFGGVVFSSGNRLTADGFAFNGAAFTVYMVVATTSGTNPASGRQTLFCNNDTAVTLRAWDDRNSGLRVGFLTTGSQWRELGTNTSIYDQNKHVIIAWYNGTSLKLYLNGTQVGTMSATGIPVSGAAGVLAIANENDGPNELFAGKIYEAASWDSALSLTDIAILSGAKVKRLPLQISPSTLLSYWDLDQCADGATCTGADQFLDLVGGNHATAEGNPAGSAETVLTYQ